MNPRPVSPPVSYARRRPAFDWRPWAFGGVAVAVLAGGAAYLGSRPAVPTNAAPAAPVMAAPADAPAANPAPAQQPAGGGILAAVLPDALTPEVRAVQAFEREHRGEPLADVLSWGEPFDFTLGRHSFQGVRVRFKPAPSPFGGRPSGSGEDRTYLFSERKAVGYVRTDELWPHHQPEKHQTAMGETDPRPDIEHFREVHWDDERLGPQTDAAAIAATERAVGETIAAGRFTDGTPPFVAFKYRESSWEYGVE